MYAPAVQLPVCHSRIKEERKAVKGEKPGNSSRFHGEVLATLSE